MKRTGNLFEKIVDLDSLLEAFHATQKGKADRLEVRRFRDLGSRLHGKCREESETSPFGGRVAVELGEVKGRIPNAWKRRGFVYGSAQ